MNVSQAYSLPPTVFAMSNDVVCVAEKEHLPITHNLQVDRQRAPVVTERMAEGVPVGRWHHQLVAGRFEILRRREGQLVGRGEEKITKKIAQSLKAKLTPEEDEASPRAQDEA